ncbi:MAG TPA: hypothetical protein VML54_12855 [Candidatus Limnocylindrales bacterium]|nr:hypothetical protein [Candidatus Limnocylindrales bacterium]
MYVYVERAAEGANEADGLFFNRLPLKDKLNERAAEEEEVDRLVRPLGPAASHLQEEGSSALKVTG